MVKPKRILAEMKKGESYIPDVCKVPFPPEAFTPAPFPIKIIEPSSSKAPIQTKTTPVTIGSTIIPKKSMSSDFKDFEEPDPTQLGGGIKPRKPWNKEGGKGDSRPEDESASKSFNQDEDQSSQPDDDWPSKRERKSPQSELR